MKILQEILRGAADGRGLRGQLTRGAIGVIALKAASMLLGLAAAVVLARALGAEGYGMYSFAFSVAMLLSIPSQVGLPTLVVREVAAAEAKGRWGLIRGLLRCANAGVLAISVAVGGAAVVVVWAMWGGAESVQAETLLWAFALVPLLSLGALRSATLQGLRHVALAQFPESVVRPLLLVALVGGAWWASGREVRPEGAMAFHVVAAATGFLVGAAFLLRRLPKEVRASVPETEVRAWLASATAFLGLGGLGTINAESGIVLLRALAGSTDAGLFSVAWRGAVAVLFPSDIIARLIAPHIARLYAERDMGRLQKLVSFSARITAAIGLSVALALVALGPWVLGLAFGVEFAAASDAMGILCLAWIIRAICGPLAPLLHMTGNERFVVAALLATVLVHGAVSLLLIPMLGRVGAAWGALAGQLVWTGLGVATVRRRTGIKPTAFGF